MLGDGESFYEEHIYGGGMSTGGPGSSALASTIDSKSPTTIDPVVRNKNSAGRSEHKRGPKLDSKGGGKKKVQNREKPEHSNRQKPKIVSSSERRLQRAKAIEESIRSESQRYVYEDALRLHKSWANDDLENLDYLNYKLTKVGQTLKKSNDCEFVEETRSPVPTIQRLVEEKARRGQYRTTLYVTSSTPKGRSPIIWDTDSARDYRSLSNQSDEEKTPSRQQFTITSVSATGNVETGAQRSSSRHAEETIRYDGVTSQQERTKITFQGPGRYIEEKPYYQTLPSPKQMKINPIISDLRNMEYTGTTSMRTPSPLLVNRTDFNQVVVDIKPRELQEADKQQHVSQWIQVGTLGDTLSSKFEGSDSNPEDFDSNYNISQLDYDDNIDRDSLSRVNGVMITRDDPNDEQFESGSLGRLHNPIEFFDSQYQQETVCKKRGVFDAIPEESDTPDTTQTASVKSNLHVSITTSPDQLSKKIHQGALVDPIPSYKPEIHSVNEPITHDANAAPVKSKPGRPINVHKSTSPTQLNHTPAARTAAKVTVSSDKQAEQKASPPTAPKPCHQVQSAMQSTSMTEFDSSCMTEYPYLHGTFPRTQTNGPKLKRDPLDLEMYATAYIENSENPGSCVKNLTAYFTDLIKQQSTNDPPKTYNITSSDRSNANSPFSFDHETPGERERRLKAVDELRKRTTPLINLDFSKPGYKMASNITRENSLDDYYPYVRPSSAPRSKTRLVTANITGCPGSVETNSEH